MRQLLVVDEVDDVLEGVLEDVVDAVLDDVLAGGAAQAPAPSQPEGFAQVEPESPAEALAFLFDDPEYRSPYQPPPLSMKLPEVMSREAASCPHEGHVLIASSVIR